MRASRAPLPRVLRSLAAGLGVAALGLTALASVACVPTLKTPLKQALPSVLGDAGATAPCWRDAGVINLPGPVRAGTLADLDGNGGLDLAAIAVVDGAYALVFAFNDGRGQLGRTTSLRLNGAPVAVRAADVNVDGYVDLLVASEPATDKEPSALHVLLGDGAGGFIAGAVALPFRPSELFVADLDGNDVVDAIIIDDDRRSAVILVGDGRGEFAVKGRIRLPGEVSPGGIALADLNGDRLADLVTVHGRGGGKAILTVHRGDGEDFRASLRVELGKNAGTVAAGDVNRDGAVDLVAFTDRGDDGSQPSAVLLLGNGAAELNFMGVRYFGPNESRSLQLIDVTGDGYLDALSLRASGDAIDTIPGDRRGGLSKIGSGPIPAGTQQLMVGDLNRDGQIEILSTGPDRSSATILQPTRCAEPPPQP